jgi:hypothetical protein
MSALEKILQLVGTADPYRNAPQNLAALQIEALRERFADMRQLVRVLEQRAADTGVVEISAPADAVPLLFAHTNYKSYPERFVDQGQWANMNRWLQTMSSRAVDVEVDGVVDVDDWLKRLEAAGHFVFATSGTSGKSSFLNRTRGDVDRSIVSVSAGFNWANGVFQPARDRPVFRFFPPYGAHPMCEIQRLHFERIGAPGEIHYMSSEPLRAMQTISAGRMRRAVAAGTARPAEIAEFEREAAATQLRMTEALRHSVEALISKRHLPIVVAAQWPMLFRIVQIGRELGVRDGDFHPKTVLSCGGGVKGATLPADYREQIFAFFGIPRTNLVTVYGMSEMTGVCPYSHDLDGYAVPPWIIPMVLDKGGERMLGPDRSNEVEGRMALFDLALEGRWGGIISGDRVTVDFGLGPRHGVHAPLIRSIARYSDLEAGEDKLTCAGTIDAYVRGSLGVDA